MAGIEELRSLEKELVVRAPRLEGEDVVVPKRRRMSDIDYARLTRVVESDTGVLLPYPLVGAACSFAVYHGTPRPGRAGEADRVLCFSAQQLPAGVGAERLYAYAFSARNTEKARRYGLEQELSYWRSRLLA